MSTILSRDGSTPGSGEQQFDPGEIAGMRSAGVILLAMAVMGVTLSAVEPSARVSASGILIDCFLGVQLLRLRHSWRAWALLRAGLGIAVAVIGLIMAVVRATDAASVLAMMGAIVYCASLWLLLYGMPTLRRVTAGRLMFALAVLMIVVEIVVRVAVRVAATA